MPPFVPRKRSQTPDVKETLPANKRSTTNLSRSNKRTKPNLFDAVDSPNAKPISLDRSHSLLDKIGGENGDTSSSEADTDDFEDVPVAKRRKVGNSVASSDEHDQEDDGMDWEDAIQEGPVDSHAEETEIGDISVSMREDGSYVEPLVSLATGKKGPSKRERHIRVLTHTLHVQTLMWHNTVRNSWLNDTEVQNILLKAVPPGINIEITRWKRSMGMLSKQELEREKAAAKKSKNNSKKGRPKKELKGRDWSYSAEHSEVGNVDMSHGDPMLRLLKLLAAYWRKRFTTTAPGLRKKGYMPLRRLREEMNGWKTRHDEEQYGERINGIKGFRELARSCEGSRDVGGQLFIALLRGVGLDVRMVANLQPAGFGFSKIEEATAKSVKPETGTGISTKAVVAKQAKQLPPPKLREALTPKQSRKITAKETTRTSNRGNKSQPINIDDSDSSLSNPPSDIEVQEEDFDVVDVTPISKKQPIKKYDRDLPHPVYWAEVLSPVSNKYIPVDPIVLSTIASNEELLQTFEPRGTKADRGKQVICYTIAFNADGTAKDVTVRYLKRHQLPGKTKGMRMPVEKVPIYNRKGKVKRYEEYDWFSELMLRYQKLESKRTKADELENETDLQPFKANKEEKTIDKESLAWYKSSAEFVLEEHLRREEALLPGAQPVKTFTAGRGDKAKDHLVYKRDEVVSCKTVESWHKEGRGLLPGEQPMKYVPIRAVTLQRKREIEDAQRETGEKLKQGLYSMEQTDWIIPPPIVNGIIPKNAFGNMDVYVPTMVPAGAVHLPMKGTARICKRLEINFAEACTGFEFGKQRAVPVITGVVVAKEHAGPVRSAWKIEQAELRRKEDIKRTATALHWWRKMLMGMRIIDRMKAEYANTSTAEDEYNPFVRKTLPAKHVHNADHQAAKSGDTDGGFLLDDDLDEQAANHDTGGGFLLDDDHEEQDDAPDTGGGLLVEDGVTEGGFIPEANPSDSNHTPFIPVSLQSMHDTKQDPRGSSAQSNGRSAKSASKPTAPRRKPAQPKVSQAKKQITIDIEDSDLSSLSDATNDVDTSAGGLSNRKGRGTTKRARISPTKSPYFSSQEIVYHDDGPSANESAGEIVAVRKTTARTRGKT